MRRILSSTLLSLIALLAILAVSGYFYFKPPIPPPSQAFINGTVITMNPQQPSAEAVLLSDGIIEWVGSKQELMAKIKPNTIIHDLTGKTLLPGFIDAHGHFPGSGLGAVGVDLNSPPIGEITDIPNLLEQIELKASETKKGDWVFGFGYDDTLLAEKRHPSKQELDNIAPDNPVFIMHISGHMGVANSQGLNLSGIDASTTPPEGGIIQKDPQGELTGLLEENAAIPAQTLAMDFSAFDFFTMVDAAAAEYASVGVTTAQSGGSDSRMAMGLKFASLLNKIPFRVIVWPIYNELGSDLHDGKKTAADFESHRIQLGAIKIIADGSIQGYTGFLSQPYHEPYKGDESYRGYPRIAQQELNDWVMKYHSAGFQLAIHGNGDAAIDNIIEAFELAQQAHPKDDPRLIVVHAQMARDDQLAKMKTLGMTPTFFSAHTYYWGDRHRDIFMGPNRAERMSPAKSAKDIDLIYSSHLDTPVVPMNPLQAVWSTSQRLSTSNERIGDAQRVSVMEALKAVTINAAWQIAQDDKIGSIEKGKVADLVVLDGNPLAEQADVAIKDIKVYATYAEGREIFKRSQ